MNFAEFVREIVLPSCEAFAEARLSKWRGIFAAIVVTILADWIERRRPGARVRDELEQHDHGPHRRLLRDVAYGAMNLIGTIYLGFWELDDQTAERSSLRMFSVPARNDEADTFLVEDASGKYALFDCILVALDTYRKAYPDLFQGSLDPFLLQHGRP